MNLDFGQLTFTSERPTYIGLPIEHIIQTNEILAKRFDENRTIANQLELVVKNTPSLKADKEYIDEILNEVKAPLQEVIESGDWSIATNKVNEAVMNFATNKKLKGITYRYNLITSKIKENEDLAKKYMEGKDGDVGADPEMVEFANTLMLNKANSKKAEFDENGELLTKDELIDVPKAVDITKAYLEIIDKVQADKEIGNLKQDPNDPYYKVYEAIKEKNPTKIYHAVYNAMMADDRYRDYLTFKAKMNVYKNRVDSNGNLIGFTEEDFNKYNIKIDNNGEFYIEEKVPLIDGSGRVVVDKNGLPIYDYEKDNSGRPILDDKGNIKYKTYRNYVSTEGLSELRRKVNNGEISISEYNKIIADLFTNFETREIVKDIAKTATTVGYFYEEDKHFLENKAALEALRHQYRKKEVEYEKTFGAEINPFEQQGYLTTEINVKNLSSRYKEAVAVLNNPNSTPLEKANAEAEIKNIKEIRKSAVRQLLDNDKNFAALVQSKKFFEVNGFTVDDFFRYFVEPEKLDKETIDKIKNAKLYKVFTKSSELFNDSFVESIIDFTTSIPGSTSYFFEKPLRDIIDNPEDLLQDVINKYGVYNSETWVQYRDKDGKPLSITEMLKEHILKAQDTYIWEEGKKIPLSESETYANLLPQIEKGTIFVNTRNNKVLITFDEHEGEGNKKVFVKRHYLELEVNPRNVEVYRENALKQDLKLSYINYGANSNEFENARRRWVNYQINKGYGGEQLPNVVQSIVTSPDSKNVVSSVTVKYPYISLNGDLKYATYILGFGKQNNFLKLSIMKDINKPDSGYEDWIVPDFKNRSNLYTADENGVYQLYTDFITNHIEALIYNNLFYDYCALKNIDLNKYSDTELQQVRNNWIFNNARKLKGNIISIDPLKNPNIFINQRISPQLGTKEVKFTSKYKYSNESETE